MIRPNQNSRGGFTLIEVMLAVGLLTLGMTAVLGLFTFGAALSQAAVLKTQSAHLVEAITQELPGRLFPLGPDGIPALPEDLRDLPVPGDERLHYHATATPIDGGPLAEDGGPLEFLVRVEVFFTQQGVRKAHTFQTRLLREQTFAERLRRRLDRPQRP
ncbi:MAG: prepilin-type N-terminal cleavage/methylation domain-containing protein [Planctomycetes bacterium]|nr:prepilin-type N-terminal cleavage/methylation domain-containing protein [Planctomycetota bacterium]MCB9908735.1 prepilin-type N-terminal cleavage/methylation domain-containing protein [Planctomycetota bacterium]MCB9912440.1 prepilin-type N-terminal cleavage/methylation domain-containing protein [Planctomycetota bacterium]HPF14867.1 prepilin-type N-terminal cleavage/methylation domain-containing protein [Planctomycetota bacterium]